MNRLYSSLPPISLSYIRRHDYLFLFESSLCDKDNFLSYIFVNPIDIIRINDYDAVADAFEKIEQYSKRFYLCGYFAYELGYFFEKQALGIERTPGQPLISLCVFEKPLVFNHKTASFQGDKRGIFVPKASLRDFRINNLLFYCPEKEYFHNISRIKGYIKRGQTYQVNFTGRFHFDFKGCAFSLYQNLKKRQSVPYSAFCKVKDNYIISLSPELYFRREGTKIYSKPMKGTISRGLTTGQDKEKACELKKNPKDRAENLMIVDLIRNDLGRICRTGTVKVRRLFDIERYNTLFQMTSTVKGILKQRTTYFDIFKSMFPGGSVTGAPKIRTMQIIKELEREERGVYCGALGIIFPQDKAVFNLPIRTISLFRHKGIMGTGGGIVIDSRPLREYQECLLKARFLTQRHNDFQLIETLLWNGRYLFFNEHLRRLKDSADYFGFVFSRKDISLRLAQLESQFKKSSRYKVRVLLAKDGTTDISYSMVGSQNLAVVQKTVISRRRTEPQDRFLYHKTTNRLLYDSEYNHYRQRGYFDVIFLNKRNEFTEGAISNIIVKLNSQYYTPPVSCGLLAGIFRGYLIRRGRVKEKVLRRSDLKKAQKIFLCNSVRGLVEVRL